MTEELLVRLLDKVENRYYGKYRAFVADNADPENRGRLKLRIPSVLGNDVVSGWALPCAPYGGAANQGFFFIPEVDASVWAEFEAGNLDYPVWVGTFWAKPGGTTEVPTPGDAQSPPTSKIIKTLNHTIELADESGNEAIKITDAANSNTIVIDSNGVVAQDTNSNTVTLDSSGVKIEDANGNVVTMDSSGVKIEDANGNAVTLDSSSVTVKGSQIKIGDGATEPLVLGNQLKMALNNWVNSTFIPHMHTGNLGAPTTPPLPGAPLVLDPALSPTNTVK